MLAPVAPESIGSALLRLLPCYCSIGREYLVEKDGEEAGRNSPLASFALPGWEAVSSAATRRWAYPLHIHMCGVMCSRQARPTGRSLGDVLVSTPAHTDASCAAMKSRMRRSVSGQTRPLFSRRLTSSEFSAARLPKYAGPIPVFARKARMSLRSSG